MSINCELASQDQYNYSALYIDSRSSLSDTVSNGHVDASKLIELPIPQVLMGGMLASLEVVTNAPAGTERPSRSFVIK